MNFNEYQKQCLTTANYKPISHSCIYPALGLANEAGEVLGKLKKVFRDDNGTFTKEKLESLADELGDVMWYCSTLAHELGFTLSEIADRNVEKLRSRQQRNTLLGDGDNR
jgi:NTP pyrophosphatase (non-canonical NTP hydrolase)